MKARGVALMLTGALLLGGCSSLNPFASTAKYPVLKPIENPIRVTEGWRVRVGDSAKFALQPVQAGDAVFAAGDESVSRIEDGRVAWKTQLKTLVSGGVGSDGGLVVVGSPKGEVIALDAASGQIKWRVAINAEVLAAPSIADGLVVVRSADSRLFGLDASDGRQRWVYQRANPPLALRSSAGVLLGTNAILAGFPGGKLAAINPSNGSLMWEGTVAVPRGATELERVADITSLPVIGPRATCAVAYQGRVACFDMGDGSTLWTRDISSSKGLDIDDNHVVVTDDKGAILALDLSTGASIWKQDQLAGRDVGRPRIVNDYVLVGDLEGYVHVLRKEDGHVVGRLRVASSPIVADMQRTGNGVIVQTRDGNVAAIGVQ